MRKPNNIDNDLLMMETLNGRRNEVIEVWESESVSTVRVKNRRESKAHYTIPASRPTLVIDEDFAQTKIFIAKARSGNVEVESVLREVFGKRSV